jgi:hypothetical protein
LTNAGTQIGEAIGKAIGTSIGKSMGTSIGGTVGEKLSSMLPGSKFVLEGGEPVQVLGRSSDDEPEKEGGY